MIPLILLALGLGAALTVYELSPRTRARVDAYARAIRSANMAHQAADAHLGNTNAAAAAAVRHTQQAGAARQATPTPPPVQWVPTAAQPTPTPTPSTPAPLQDVADAQVNAAEAATDAAVDNAVAAIEANQDAAQNTAEAAKTAQDEAQRRAAAESAAKVLEREAQIEEALRTLGVGQCDVKPYPGVTERVKNTLLAKLRTEGMAVTGDNPWNIDTRQYGVKLRAVWDPKAQFVKLIVTTGKGGYWGMVTCTEIWKKIDPIMKGVLR